ncbi:Ppx/GppA phosphatase family protein [Kozakia baliensis]|uniref:Ppx/GppA phosphatase family protein n=1 Tax=Kozakia baliensis TaxID=153496 RepID=UPI00345BF212
MNYGKEQPLPLPDRFGTDRSHSVRAPQSPAYFGALDLGTNNCRLMVAMKTANGFRIVDSFNRSVRLGEGLQKTGQLSEHAMERTLDALRTCAHRLKHWPVLAIRGVATEACRRAANGMSFLSRVLEETGLQIDVISPREEAELAIESCSALLHREQTSRQRGLLFDIGGGSTEIAWLRIDRHARQQSLMGLVSIPVGVITMAERFPPPPLEASIQERFEYYNRMVSYVAEHLQTFEDIHRIRREISLGHVGLLGTSGTVTTLAGIALKLERYNRHAIDGLSLKGSEALAAIHTLCSLDKEGLNTHPCVGPDRSAYVLPGCAIFEAIHRVWPADTVTVADRGLRDGLLMRMAREHARPQAHHSASNSRSSFRSHYRSSTHGAWTVNSAI